jgi:threonine dehydratase
VQAKLEKTNVYGVEVILHGAETGLAEQYAQSLAGTGRYTYISPYGDPDVIAGEGTVAVEILEQCKDINANGNGTVGVRRVVDNFFVAMSGGGLIRGMGSVMKVLSPSTKVYGGSAVNSMALPASTKAGSVVEDEHRETLADAVAGPLMEIRLRCRWPWWLWMLLWSVRKGEFRKRSGSLRPGEDVG